MKQTILTLAITAACLSSTSSQAMNTRIIGGAESASGSYPWMVSLNAKNGEYFCGASLISNNWVMTAAHCIEEENAASIEVIVGEFDQSKVDAGEQKRDIKRIVVHPNRSHGEAYDIALLELASPATGSTVSLATTELNDSISAGSSLTVMGWGNLSTTGESFPNRLNEVQVPLVSQEECKAALGNDISDDTICAGLEEGGKDSCQGDSGGPLVHQKDGEWHQVGIVSWGDGCAQANSPGVYARVSYFGEWIANVKAGTNTGGDQPTIPTPSPGEENPDEEYPTQAFNLPEWLDLYSYDNEVVEESLELENNTENPVSISGISIDDSAFTLINNSCEVPVAPGNSCNISFSYTPSSAEYDLANLNLITNDATEVNIELYGENLTSFHEDDYYDEIDWYSDDSGWMFSDDDFSLDCGNINEGVQSTLEAFFEGAGFFEFDFSLPDDSDENTLSYYVDGKAVRTVRGGQKVTTKHSTELSEGKHRITWVYTKKTTSSGEAKVSNVKFTRAAPDASSTDPSTGGGSQGPLTLMALLGFAALRKTFRK